MARVDFAPVALAARVLKTLNPVISWVRTGWFMARGALAWLAEVDSLGEGQHSQRM